MEGGCDVNVCAAAYNGTSPLMLAAGVAASDRLVQLLLQHGAWLDVRDANDNTVLHHAALGKSADVMATLLSHVLRFHVVNHEGASPSELATDVQRELIVRPTLDRLPVR